MGPRRRLSVYTPVTSAELADHLFDWTSVTDRRTRAAGEAVRSGVSTLRPTAAFVQKVHQHIRVPYLLLTDTADDPTRRASGLTRCSARAAVAVVGGGQRDEPPEAQP